MELIARDGRIIELAVLAHLVYETADLIVLLDGAHERLVRGVNTEFLSQGLQDMGPQLLAVVLIAVLRLLEGHVRELAEEIRVLD